MRNVVVEGWTGKLFKLLWDNLHLPCIWSFSRAAWRKTNIVCQGKCAQKECKATVEVALPHRTNNLLISIGKFESSVMHDPKKKRRLQQNEKGRVKDHVARQIVLCVKKWISGRNAGRKFTRTARLAYIEHTEIDQKQRSVFCGTECIRSTEWTEKCARKLYSQDWLRSFFRYLRSSNIIRILRERKGERKNNYFGWRNWTWSQVTYIESKMHISVYNISAW